MLEQVRELLQNKKTILEENNWTDREEYRQTVNRLSELEYHEARTALESQRRVEEIIKLVMQEEERATVQEQKLAEVDEMELPFDFDADFGTVGVNQIVRQMLKEERAKNFAEFNHEFNRLQSEHDEALKGFEERELQLERQNEELQEQNRKNEKTIETLYNEAKSLRDQVTALSADNAALKQENHDLKARNEEIEKNRKNAADQLDEYMKEVLRLEDQLDEMRRAQLMGERVAQRVIDVTATTKDLYEQAKQATAAKRQVMVTDNIGLYREIVDAQGNKEVVHASQLDEVEVVESFPDLPEIEPISDQEPIGTEFDVAEETMVLEGIEDTVDGDPDQERETAGAETTETAQETQDSEEVEETFEQEVRRRLNNLEQTIFGYVDGQEAA